MRHRVPEEVVEGLAKPLRVRIHLRNSESISARASRLRAGRPRPPRRRSSEIDALEPNARRHSRPGPSSRFHDTRRSPGARARAERCSRKAPRVKAVEIAASAATGLLSSWTDDREELAVVLDGHAQHAPRCGRGPTARSREHLVVTFRVTRDDGSQVVVADVPGCDERVPSQPARSLRGTYSRSNSATSSSPPRSSQSRSAMAGVASEGGCVRARLLLDRPVPGAHVLTDVAPVDAAPELGAMRLGNRVRRLGGVGEASPRIEHSGLVERTRGTRVDARRARSAVELEARAWTRSRRR